MLASGWRCCSFHHPLGTLLSLTWSVCVNLFLWMVVSPWETEWQRGSSCIFKDLRPEKSGSSEQHPQTHLHSNPLLWPSRLTSIWGQPLTYWYSYFKFKKSVPILGETWCLFWSTVLHCLLLFSSSVMSDSLWPYGLYSMDRLLCPWNAPNKHTGVGCHSSFRGSSWLRVWKWKC